MAKAKTTPTPVKPDVAPAQTEKLVTGIMSAQEITNLLLERKLAAKAKAAEKAKAE